MNFESELPIAECVFQEGDCLILSPLNKISQEHINNFNNKNSHIRFIDFYGVDFLKDEKIDISVFKNLKELQFTNCYNIESIINNSSSDTLKFLYIKSFKFMLRTLKEYPHESFNLIIESLERFKKLSSLSIERYNKVTFMKKPSNIIIRTDNVNYIGGLSNYSYEELRAEKELRKAEHHVSPFKLSNFDSPRTSKLKLIEPDF